MTPTTRIHVVDDLSAQYLLETHHDQQVKLDFIHNHPNTRSNIAILIIAKGTANVTLDATVTVLAEAINTSTQLDIYVVTEPTAKVTAAPNLIIDNNLVNAGHTLTTINLAKQDAYYLASRGIDSHRARQLQISNLLAKFANAIKL